VITMRNRHATPLPNHKNLTRLDFIRGFNPTAGEKLRQMLEEQKEKEKDK